MNEGIASTGQSSDSATLHVGVPAAQGPMEELPSAEEQRAALEAAYEPPDRSGWVSCLPGCHWANDGSARDSGRSTPPAVHADGCPHAGDRYVHSIPTLPPA